jgi:hypothetical protein
VLVNEWADALTMIFDRRNPSDIATSSSLCVNIHPWRTWQINRQTWISMKPLAKNQASTVILSGLTMITVDRHTTGDGEETARLDNEVQNRSTRYLNRLRSHIARSINSEAKQARDAPQAGSTPQTAELQNPYEGREGARQLDETVDDFLRRLPVLTSETVSGWLWIANFRTGKNFDDAQLSSLYAEFVKRGRQLLDMYIEKKKRVEKDNPHLSTGWVARKLGPDRDKLRDAILKTATECKETCGKARALSNIQAQH